MFGLTQTEKKAIAIIVLTMILALAVQLFFPLSIKENDLTYAAPDSVFQAKILQHRPVKTILPSERKDEIVNINTASVTELENLPGIGRIIAKRIIEYRSVHGPFKSYADLQAVKGLGVKKIQQFKDKIKF